MRNINYEFYNDLLEITSLKEIKDLNMKPMAGAWIIPLITSAVSAMSADAPGAKIPGMTSFNGGQNNVTMPDLFGSYSQNSPLIGKNLSSNLLGDEWSPPKRYGSDNDPFGQKDIISQLTQKTTDELFSKDKIGNKNNSGGGGGK